MIRFAGSVISSPRSARRSSRLGRGLVFVRNEHCSATNLDDFIAGIAVMRAAIGETVR